MPHDGGNFIVRQVQFTDQTGIKRDFSARHDMRVDLWLINQNQFPLPFGSVIAKHRHMRHHALHDGVDAVEFLTADDQVAFLSGLRVLLRVVLQRSLVHGLRRNNQQL